MNQHRTVHVARLPLVFPAGLSAGEGREGATSPIAVDGLGRPVLRGTSTAGALRHAYARAQGDLGASSHSVDDLFGKAPEGDDAVHPSPLRVADSVFDIRRSPDLRQHNAIDRHRGAVADTGLFQLEALPPGACTDLRLVLDLPGLPSEDGEAFLDHLVGLVRAGLWFGGSRNRGVGLSEIPDEMPARRWSYNLTEAATLSQYLDDDYAYRRSGDWPSQPGQPLDAPPPTARLFKLTCTLAIPRGQDLLVADGQGSERDSEPQRVVACDSKEYWRLPGSSLRGLFRAWYARLAARDDEPVADAADAYDNDLNNGAAPMSHADRVGWCREAEDARKRILAQPGQIQCPVATLFGSLYARGRLVITDAYAPLSKEKTQTCDRVHIAVDRFSGGVNEGAFFTDRVLLAGTRFPLVIHIEDPEPIEVQRLAQTLQALDAGLIRVGSSKSAGRLEVHDAQPSGRHADAFHFSSLLQESHHG